MIVFATKITWNIQISGREVGKGESRWLINVLSWILAWSFE
jgi:hypothetical protein